MKPLNKWILAGLLAVSNSVFSHDYVNGPPTDAEVNSDGWFEHTLFDSNIWRVKDYNQANLFLIEGKDSALLIDTGLGYKNIHTYLKRLTDKPLIAINSHAHPDHAGGNYQFEHVHIHKEELETLKHYTSEAILKDTLLRFVDKDMPDHLLDKNKTLPELTTIGEGFVFDLGDREVQVIHTPGHSPGSISLLDTQSQSMFTGDMTNQHVWLQIKHATSVEDFLQSILKLKTYSSSIKRLFPGHGEPSTLSRLSVLEKAAKKILSGECTITPYHSPLGEAISCEYEDVVIVYKNVDSDQG